MVRPGGGVPVQLGPKLLDDGDRLCERSARLGHQPFDDTGRVQVRLQRGGAGLEAVDDRPQPFVGPRDRCRRGTGRPAQLLGTHRQRVDGRDRRRRELCRGIRPAPDQFASA